MDARVCCDSIKSEIGKNVRLDFVCNCAIHLVNKCEEILHDMELGIQTERFFKDITTQRLDHIKYMIAIEQEQRQLSRKMNY